MLRRAALGDREDLLDRSAGEIDTLNVALGREPDRAKRIRSAELAAADTMAAWYSKFATAVGERQGFALYQLMPERAAPVLAWLRLSTGGLSAAAQTLVRERGLLAMIDRLGALPIEPTAAMIALFEDGVPADREEALEGLADLPPWHALFLLKLLRPSSRSNRALLRTAKTVALAAAVDPARKSEWRLFASLARYIASKAPELKDWSSLEAEQQLAFVWAHASKIAISLMMAQVEPASVAEYLDKATTASPRELVERRSKFAADSASPMAGSTERLRVRATLSVLFALNGKSKSGPIHAALKSLLVAKGGKRGNELLLAAALAPSALENSFFCIDFGPAVGALFPVAQFSFGAAMIGMVDHILGEPESAPPFRRVWTFLRQASGDAPLRPELAALARAKLADLELGDAPDGLDPALHTIIAVAALAAVNGWPEVSARLDATVPALWTAASKLDDRRSIFFEIAHWRARLEASTFERGRIIVDALRRIATADENFDWAISVAQRFARALAGHDAEPFIDFMAEAISGNERR